MCVCLRVFIFLFADCGEFCCDEEEEGSVRLVGGRRASEGYVELCLDGQWGTLCDQAWDGRDAGVICHMLGFHRQSESRNSITKPLVSCDICAFSRCNCIEIFKICEKSNSSGVEGAESGTGQYQM